MLYAVGLGLSPLIAAAIQARGWPAPEIWVLALGSGWAGISARMQQDARVAWDEEMREAERERLKDELELIKLREEVAQRSADRLGQQREALEEAVTKQAGESSGGADPSGDS